MPWANQPSEQPTDFAYDNWSQHLAPAFRAALQNIYGRGMDISSNAPWQVLDQAFPRVGSAQLRQGHDADLMDAARMFMSGQTPQKPGMLDKPPLWMDDTGTDAGGLGGGVGPGGIVGANPASTSIFGSVLGAGLGGIPGLALSALTTAASGKNSAVDSALNVFGLPGLNLSNPLSQAFQNAFPLSQVGPRGELSPVSPVSPGMFNSSFATPGVLSQAIGNAQNFADAYGQVSPGEMTLDSSPPDPSPQGVVNSAVLALANNPTQNTALVQSLNALGTPQGHPAFGFQGFNPAFTVNFDEAGVSGPGGASTAGDGSGSTAGGAGSGPAGGASSTGPGEGNAGGPGSAGPGASSGGQGNDGGMGGLSSGIGTGTGAPGSGTAGTAGGGNTGGGPTGGAESYTGGPVADKKHKGFKRSKGSHVVPINAHEGEFVVNPNATKAAKPALEALNSLIPSNPRNREDLEEIVKRAAKYFDVA